MATRTIVRLADQAAGFLTNASASTTYQAKVANVSDAEIGYLDGVTSGIQSQINSKLSESSASSTYLTQASASTTYAKSASPTFTGTVTLPSTTSIGTVSSTEIGYVYGVTSAIQTQLNAKAPTANPTFSGTVNTAAINGSGDISTTGWVGGVTSAAAGRGLLVRQPSGDGSAAIIQFTNNAVTAQRAVITANSAGDVALSGTGTSGTAATTDISNGVRMSEVYNKTTTAAANMLIATIPLAYLYRSTASSGRWKNSIENLSGELNANKLLELPVHQFKFNNDYLDENDQRYETFVPGFIAEEVAEVYPIAAELDGEGLPSDWNVRLLLPPMLQLIQDQAKKIEELELRIFNIENN